MRIRINWEKVGAYTVGGLLGGGLSALAWHVAEKHGFNPGTIFRKKVVQGNITYYDPEKDPNVADLMDELGDVEVEEGLDVLSEEYDEGYGEDEGDGDDGGTDGINEPRIYLIDNETWYRSEDEMGYKHAEMKYYIDDQQMSDEKGLLIQKPWLLIGGEAYDMLSDENCDTEIFVRNEELETDFVVTRTDGSFD